MRLFRLIIGECIRPHFGIIPPGALEPIAASPIFRQIMEKAAYTATLAPHTHSVSPDMGQSTVSNDNNLPLLPPPQPPPRLPRAFLNRRRVGRPFHPLTLPADGHISQIHGSPREFFAESLQRGTRVTGQITRFLQFRERDDFEVFGCDDRGEGV